MEAVFSPATMKKAYDRVCANKGSAGVDGIGVAEFKAHLKRHWPTVKASKYRYHPSRQPSRCTRQAMQQAVSAHLAMPRIRASGTAPCRLGLADANRGGNLHLVNVKSRGGGVDNLPVCLSFTVHEYGPGDIVGYGTDPFESVNLRRKEPDSFCHLKR